MKIVNALFVFLCIAEFSYTDLNYEVINTEEGNQIIVSDSNTGTVFEGPTDYWVNIESINDFDLNGTDDALVSTSSGGNCCPTQYSILTIKGDALLRVDLNYEWSEVSAIVENNQHFIHQKSNEKTDVYTFDGQALKLVRSIKPMASLKEIKSSGKSHTVDNEIKVLAYDIDSDGVDERITCRIWERWGSLICTLPTSKTEKQELSIGCNRFGVLSSKNHGFNQFVCNNDIIISFDGKNGLLQKKNSNHIEIHTSPQLIN